MTASEPPAFRLVPLKAARDRIRRWGKHAESLGLLPPLLEALRLMEERLQVAPIEWGDPLYRLRGMGLLVRRGFANLFFVQFAVDEANRLVYVLDLLPLPGHPLGDDPAGKPPT